MPRRTRKINGRADASFPIVGVGASAGGLEAFTELLANLPLDTGMGFVFVQHLDPKHPSALVELLQRVTALPVREVTNNVVVQPNHVYVIPPNTGLSIAAGALSLSPRSKKRIPARSIDAFFEALARDQQECAIGVILSGTATDGTLGLEEIKAEGGITFAQDESARYDSMPRTAVAAGCVDFVLSPKAIASELTRIAGHPAVSVTGRPAALQAENDRASATAPQEDDTPLPSGGGGTPSTGAEGTRYEARRNRRVTTGSAKNDDGFKRTLLLLRDHSGIDFSLYKSSTIRRRITRRMVLSKQDAIHDYAAFLRGNTKELDALYSDVLISVTSFFRNPESFDVLQRRVWPELLKQRRSDPIRVWVLGCSTGQEAYSIAMSFMEVAEQSPRVRALQVFATDLNEALLDKARQGLYAKSIAQDLAPERLRRFFVEEDGGFRVTKTLREKVVFARQNVIGDPPFSRLDVISCRNLLIYFEPELQKRVFPVFHYALKPDGFLSLGASESIGTFTELFEPFDQKHKIFRRRAAALALPLKAGVETREPVRSRASEIPQRDLVTGVRPADGAGAGSIVLEADRLMVSRFSPPAVLIDANLQVVQFRGPTGAYFEPPKGKASFDVLKMARRGLMLPLRAAINKAKKDKKAVRRENLRVEQDHGTRTVTVEVIPLRNPGERCFLIVFEDVAQGAGAPGARPPATSPPRRAATAGPRRSPVGTGSRRVSELEAELAETLDYLHAVQEQHEGANDALQASNEEIQSANEELQSINEELQTSKEELESANEELMTVNEEMGSRNDELGRLNDDLVNTQKAARQTIILLARNLTIRRFSAQAEKQFNLLADDVGRPLHDVRHNLLLNDLEDIISQVIDTVRPEEREVQDRDGRWFSLRILPYMTLDNKVDGAVLVLVDIEALKRSERAIDTAREYADNIIDTLREPLVVLDADLRVERANRAFFASLGINASDTIGRPLYEIGHELWADPMLLQLLRDIVASNTSVEDYSITGDVAHLPRRTLLLSAQRLHDPKSTAPRIVMAIEDVTERRQVEIARNRLAEIVASSDDAIISRDLDDVVTSWNSGAVRLFGYTASEAIGSSVASLLVPSGEHDDHAALFERLGRNETIVPAETVRRRKDGSLVEVAETDSPIRTAEGHLMGAATISRDVTASKAQAEELRQSDRRKDEFLAMLGHELRNPLAPILTALEMMKLRGADVFIRERDVINRQVRHVARLVDDMLDVARITRGKVSLEKEPIEIAVVIAKAIEIAEPLIDQRAHRLEVAVAEAGLVVDADPFRLSQVFANLLTNAARYTEPGGRIAIDAALEGDTVCVDVTDSGMGLSADFLPRVFDLFVQGDRSADRSQGGLGLGLALVQSLVKLHGGSVTAHSEGLGKGSLFRVRIPAAASPTIAVERGPWPASRKGEVPYRRILLVDDNADAVDMLHDMLVALAYQVVVAYDGPQALIALESFSADVAVIDIGLPLMDGYELAERIRRGESWRVPKLIAMTGYGQPADRARSRAAGFDFHLVKPVDMAALMASFESTVTSSPGTSDHDSTAIDES